MIASLSTRREKFDLTSSGQRSSTATQVVATPGDATLANAVEYVTWNQSPMQFILCTQCLAEGCESGGWLQPRLAGDYVVLTPAYERMAESGTADGGPPRYVERLGIPLLAVPLYQELGRLLPGLLAPAQLEWLNGAELLRCMQWEAPLRVMGRPPQAPELVPKRILAVSEGNAEEGIASLSTAMQELAKAPEVVLEELAAPSTPLTFYLDGPHFPEWAPLAALPGQAMRLLLTPRMVARPR
jgi:hypothetical protein